MQLKHYASQGNIGLANVAEDDENDVSFGSIGINGELGQQSSVGPSERVSSAKVRSPRHNQLYQKLDYCNLL